MTTMPEKDFFTLFNSHSNQNKWAYRYKWDQDISRAPKLQHAILHSKSCQTIYAHTETKLTQNYADILDAKIKEAFQRMPKEDFLNPEGFEQSRKTTEAQKNYLNTIETISYMIWHEITPYSSRDAQLHAYKRWIGVAELLFRRQNYDACHQVLINLELIDGRLHLSNELPESNHKSLNKLINLFEAPYAKFLSYYTHHQTNMSLMPILALSNVVIKQNTIIEKAQSEIQQNQDINHNRQIYQTISTQKRNFLHSTLNCHLEIKELAPELQAFFTEMRVKHQKDPNKIKLRSPKQQPPSDLFTKNLKSSFWNPKLNLAQIHHFIDLDALNPHSI